MKIRFLGAHNCERQSQKMVSLLIDDVLAIDAGSITSSLPLAEQKKIKALLLTHQHYDHVRDIPGLAMSLFLGGGAIRVYSIQSALDALAKHFLNSEVYTDFRRKPEDKPTLSLAALEPNKAVTIEGYTVLAVPVKHGVPTMGYQVTSADGRSVFYTGDTGPGLAECWQRVNFGQVCRVGGRVGAPRPQPLKAGANQFSEAERLYPAGGGDSHEPQPGGGDSG